MTQAENIVKEIASKLKLKDPVVWHKNKPLLASGTADGLCITAALHKHCITIAWESGDEYDSSWYLRARLIERALFDNLSSVKTSAITAVDFAATRSYERTYDSNFKAVGCGHCFRYLVTMRRFK